MIFSKPFFARGAATMGSINKAWHLAHKMPKNPTKEQRLLWHAGHLEHCTCRMPTPKLKKELEAFLKAAKRRS